MLSVDYFALFCMLLFAVSPSGLTLILYILLEN
jgi:hypothetical protein